MILTNNMVCGCAKPNAESGTKCPKITTPNTAVCAHRYLHSQMFIEFSEKIRKLALDIFGGGRNGVENV